ncbi:hypothetical protein [Halobacteriovorax sp. YZS-1-1]|uniref:hypothetical protein n=1 Tax=unclassified Halobacteriovorax TaxID=2639665 RepID=UPI0039999254
MNKIKMTSLALLLVSSTTATAGITDFFSTKDKVIKGSAHHFYNDSRSDALTEFVQDIHSEYGLFIARFKEHSETYIGAHNKDKMKRFGTDVTAYSDLTFSKHGDSYRLYYTTYATGRPVIIKLDKTHNDQIDGLFEDMTKKADHVKIEGTRSFSRGGISLTAKNLKDVKSITLSCKEEIHSDNSGGNRCLTKTGGIDFGNKETKVEIKGARRNTEVPKKNLKTWAQDYWNNKI